MSQATPRGSRSLRVHPDYIARVKSAVRQSGFPRQKDLVEEVELAFSTVSNFLNGKPVDFVNFVEICDKLSLDWRQIYDRSFETGTSELAVLTNGEAFHSLDVDQNFMYVKRPQIEQQCDEELQRPGSLIRIKAPHLMGKTSLIAKVLNQAKKRGYRTAYLTLQMANAENFEDLAQLLKWLCASVSQALDLPNRIKEFWDEEFCTINANCIDYFEKYLLTQANSPLVLCLDEVERVFPHSRVAADFLGLLRAWHEMAKPRPIWQQLRLIIAYSTEMYVPLKVNESPFNVGLEIDLPEFTFEQVQSFAQQHGLTWTDTQIEQLMDMLGGHPYLVEQAFAYLKTPTNSSLEQFLQIASTDSSIYGKHLRRLWIAIQKNRELIEPLETMVQSSNPVQLGDKQIRQLYQLGLVHQKEDSIMPRCRLYRQYFANRLGG